MGNNVLRNYIADFLLLVTWQPILGNFLRDDVLGPHYCYNQHLCVMYFVIVIRQESFLKH